MTIEHRLAVIQQCTFVVCNDGSLIAVRGRDLATIRDGADAIVQAGTDIAALLRLARVVDFYGEALIQREYEPGSPAIRELVLRARDLVRDGGKT